MKRTIVITSIFAVCILMALPLTSVAESSNMPVKKINRLRTMLVDAMRDEMPSIEHTDVSAKQGLSIGCILWIILLIPAIAFYIVVSALQELYRRGTIYS